MAKSNWKPIDQAPKGIGAVLLRVGPGISDPAFVGRQADDGRWFDTENREVQPAYFCMIPSFDCEAVV